MSRGFRIDWQCTFLALLALLAAACSRPPETPIRQPLVTIPVVNNVSNFNGTAIPAGRYIWFSSVMKVSGVGSQPVHLYFNRSKIQFTAGGTPYSITVPDSEITIDPAAASASTTFDAASQTWKTVLPSPWSGNAFLGGVSFPVPVNLKAMASPVRHSNRSAVSPTTGRDG